jgi:hypothetical protein
MKTVMRSIRINAPLALSFAVAPLAIALAAPAQTTPEPPYAVTDVGANYRVWQRTVQVPNSATGEATQQVQGYTELDEGMNYWTTNSAQAKGGWVESQDLIEITPTGARAVHGQMKAVISADVTSTGAITLTTASGHVFQSRPLGLYYADPSSGKVAQVALVQPGRGLLYAPNVVVFTNAFSGLNADLMLVWARNGFEQNVVLKQSPPPPETFGISSASCRLQMWTAMDQCPEPVEDRPALLSSGLWDHILIFPDCWFPVGSAYEFGSAPLPNAGEAATVRPVGPSDKSAFPTAKSLVTIADQKVLIEEINYSDLLPAFKALGHASLPPRNPKAIEFAARGRLVPAPPATRQDRPILLAAGPYQARGIVLDYIQLSGSTSSYTFNSGTCYYIPVSYLVGPGAATFQNNSCLKFGSNAQLNAYGPVSFPSSGAPVVFTSKDDNVYGATISGSTASPNFAAQRALWSYYNAQLTNVQSALFRWAQTAVELNAFPGSNNVAIYSSAFQNCQTGVYVNMPSDTLYLSDDTYCNVASPVSVYAGTVSGSMTADCGVVSVAMVNDPNQDQDPMSVDTNKNSECECTFILANNSSTIVAAFADTHLSEVDFGNAYTFSNIPTPRSTWWSRSTNGGLSFTNTQPLPPSSTSLTNTWWGDALNPMMSFDPNYPSNSSGTVYLLANPSREQGSWFGFRLWTSTNNGQGFTLINTNVPGGSSGVIKCDRPTVKVDPSSHYLYAAGTSSGPDGIGMFAARSTNHGINWDLCKAFDKPGGQTDIAIQPNGPVYVFWITYPGTAPIYTNQLRYAWLMPGSTNWSGPNDVGITLNSTDQGGHRWPLRFNGDSSDDNFEIIPFPRAAYANSHIYLAYSDLPSTNQSTTDKGDIFLAELNISPSDGSLTLTMPPRVVNDDHTQTDQWDAAIAANPQETELFIGYYSRQEDPTSNSLIKAYGAKVYKIAGGLRSATIDCFPISPTAFPPLFSGTNAATNLQFDPVYPADEPSYASLCFDQFARVDYLCPGCFCSTNDVEVVAGNPHFFQDDNTWADADTNYFYYAWCDRSRTWTWTALGAQNTRPDADVKLAKIRQ